MSDYTVLRADEVPDPLGDVPGEIRFLTDALGCRDVAVTLRVMAPRTGHIRGDRNLGHRHKTQEEVYLVASGRVEMKLDDEVIEVGPRTAVRIAPQVARSMYNPGDEEAVVVLVSTHEADVRADAEFVPDFWPQD